MSLNLKNMTENMKYDRKKVIKLQTILQSPWRSAPWRINTWQSTQRRASSCSVHASFSSTNCKKYHVGSHFKDINPGVGRKVIVVIFII